VGWGDGLGCGMAVGHCVMLDRMGLDLGLDQE
jgi:hypothetical protein